MQNLPKSKRNAAQARLTKATWSDFEPRLQTGCEALKLTRRETEVVKLVIRGFPHKAIAAELGITKGTVSFYLDRVFLKAGVHSAVQLTGIVIFPRLRGL